MRLPEQILWDDLRKEMGGQWEADRVENSLGRDMPDIYFRFGGEEPFCGWIELKQIFSWSRQKGRKTGVPTFTRGQKGWLSRHHRAGANCWVLLHVRLTNEYIFMPGDKAGILGDVTEQEVKANSYEYFHGLPNHATIRSILQSRGEE